MNWQPGEMLKTLQASAHDLAAIPDQSVHAIITSPPYLNLREYAGEQVIDWPEVSYRPMPNIPEITVPAWRGALGGEPTIEMYIGHMVLCLREWWRVLRKDGICVVNLGDTYTANRSYHIKGTKQIEGSQPSHGAKVYKGLKQKDLCLVPERFALAAQADGWYVRAKPPWIKRNAQPDSTTDRPSSSHESVWLLTKRARYYWDMEAVKQAVSEGSKKRLNQTTFDTQTGGEKDYRNGTNPNRSARQALENFAEKAEGGRFLRTGDFMFWSMQIILDGGEAVVMGEDGDPLVLVVNPRGYSKSHFATFPPQLVEPFVLAGTSEKGCCPTCGAPWRRVIEKPNMEDRPTRADDAKTSTEEIHVSNGWAGHPKSAGQAYQEWRNENPNRTIGWEPTCECYGDDEDRPVEPCIVLDPFVGSGTTCSVALKHRRRAIGGDISGDYLDEHVPDRTTVQMQLV